MEVWEKKDVKIIGDSGMWGINMLNGREDRILIGGGGRKIVEKLMRDIEGIWNRVEEDRVEIEIKIEKMELIRIDVISKKIRRIGMGWIGDDGMKIEKGDKERIRDDGLKLRIEVKSVEVGKRIIVKEDEDRGRKMWKRGGIEDERKEIEVGVKLIVELEEIIERRLERIREEWDEGGMKKENRMRRKERIEWEREGIGIIDIEKVLKIMWRVIEDVIVKIKGKKEVIIEIKVKLRVIGDIRDLVKGGKIVGMCKEVFIWGSEEWKEEIDEVGWMREIIVIVGIDGIKLVERKWVGVKLVEIDEIFVIEGIDDVEIEEKVMREWDGGKIKLRIGGGNELGWRIRSRNGK